MDASTVGPGREARWQDGAARLVPHLTILRGTGVGVVHRILGRTIKVGRALDSDVRIEHPSVSRRHAHLTVAGKWAFIEDVGSASGTLVGIHAARGPTPVPQGAVIALGALTLLRMTYSEGAAEEAPSSLRSLRTTVACMTGAAFFTDQLRGAIARACCQPSPLTLVLFRADDLDQASDVACFDHVMGELGVAVHEETADEDLLARTARDQFALLLRTNVDQAKVIAESVRARLAPPDADGSTRSITGAVIPVRSVPAGREEPFFQWAARSAESAIAGVRNRIVTLDATGLPDRRRPAG
jgi:GGDEF domain-containing protein